MANQRIPDLTEDTSRLDTDQYVVHKLADARAKYQKGSTVRGGLAATTRTISTTSPLSGGGDLSANRTLSITDVNGLTGTLSDAQKVAVRKNSGVIVSTRAQLNLIEGSNVTLTVADDSGSGECDITIASAGGGVTERWARVRKSGNQTILITTDTALTWDTEDADTDTFHDNVTNNPRLVVPASQAGRYLIEAGVRISTISSGQRIMTIRKNGTTPIVGATSPGISTVNMYMNCFCVVDLAVADYVEVLVYSTVQVDVLADQATHFVIRKLS